MRLDWKAYLGVVLSLLLLWWVLRDVEVARVVEEMRGADPLLFLAAVAVTTSSFLVRALRWRVLLVPIHRESRLSARFAAVNIGFMANNLLPARVGEFARAYALSRMEPVSMSGSFGSLVVERLLDGIVLVGLLVVAVAAPTFPGEWGGGGRSLQGPVTTLGSVFLVAGVVLFALVRWPHRTVRVLERAAARLPWSVVRSVVDALEAFLEGLGVLREPGLFLRALLWTVGLWTWHATSFLLAFRAFGIEVDYVGALFLQSLIALAVALPSAPGFFGPFEAGARVGLVAVYGVEVHQALSFAIGFHIGGFIPVTVLGLFYLWRLGISLREVEASEVAVEEAMERVRPLTREETGDGGGESRPLPTAPRPEDAGA